MGRLDGRVAIVTGAAHGARAAIGAKYAVALAREGAMVMAADIRDVGSVVAEIVAGGGKALGLYADMRDEVSINDMVARTVEHFGGVDVLVNNAGVGSNIPPVPVEELDAGDWDDLMAVNVRGPFLCIKAVVPVMKKKGYGKIVNVGSATMFNGLPDRLHYVTAKGAIFAMTRALAREVGPFGIRVNTIAYGLVSNPVTEEEFQKNPVKRDKILGARALGTHVYPEDLTGTLVYLAATFSIKSPPRRYFVRTS